MSDTKEMLQKIYDMQIKQMHAIEKIDLRLVKLEQLHGTVSDSNGAIFRSPAPSTSENKNTKGMWPPSPMMQDDFFDHILSINQRLSKVEQKRTCPPLLQKKILVDNSTSPSRKERKVYGSEMNQHETLVSMEQAKTGNSRLKSPPQKESLEATQTKKSLKDLENEQREANIAALLSQAPPPPPPEPPVALKANDNTKQADLKRKLQLLRSIKRRRSSGTR